MNSSNPPDHQNFSAYSPERRSESQKYTPPPPSQPQQYHPPPPASAPQYSNQPATGIPVKTGPSSTSVAWSTSLFGCFEDIPNCIITCCCPCITFGQIAEIVDKGNTSCFRSGARYFLHVLGVPCIYSGEYYRTKLRNQYTLHELPCADGLVHCCCDHCALCQEYRELKNHGFDMSIGWEGNVVKQGRELAMPPMAQGMTR